MRQNKIAIYGVLLTVCILAGCGQEELEPTKGGFLQIIEQGTEAFESSTMHLIPENESLVGGELPVLRFALYGSTEPTNEMLQAVQELLADRGIMCQLHIVPISEMDEEYAKALQSLEEKEGVFDLINTGLWFSGSGAARFAEENLVELDSYLDTEEGTALYEVVPALYWETVNIDGTHYTVPAPGKPFENSCYIALRKDAAKEEPFDGSLEMLLDMFEEEQAENGGQMQLYIENASDMIARQSGYQLVENMLFHEKSMEFVRIEEATDLAENMEQLHSWMNFGDRKESWIHLVNSDEISSNLDRCYAYLGFEECAEVLDGEFEIYRGVPGFVLNGVGMTTGVAKRSEKRELALQVLQLLYTDREFADLLVYGPKESYAIENGCIVPAEETDVIWAAYRMGIYAQTTPSISEGIANRMEEIRRRIPSEEYFVLAGTIFREADFAPEQWADREQMQAYLCSWMEDQGILLLDEPLNGLDNDGVQEMQDADRP